MKKNYFANLSTANEINNVYKALCLAFHPDHGGDEETMKEINRQRSAALAALEQGTAPAAAGLELPAAVIGLPEKAETSTAPAELMERIEKASRLPCVHVELCGSWLWVTGSTQPVKEQLKALGFHFSGNKKAWYWHDPRQKRRRSRRRYDMDEIREMHGSQKLA